MLSALVIAEPSQVQTTASSKDFASSLEAEEVQYITARAVWERMESKRNVLHLGTSVSQRDNAGTENRVSNSVNIATGEIFLKSARFYPESIITPGVEEAWP